MPAIARLSLVWMTATVTVTVSAVTAFATRGSLVSSASVLRTSLVQSAPTISSVPTTGSAFATGRAPATSASLVALAIARHCRVRRWTMSSAGSTVPVCVALVNANTRSPAATVLATRRRRALAIARGLWGVLAPAAPASARRSGPARLASAQSCRAPPIVEVRVGGAACAAHVSASPDSTSRTAASPAKRWSMERAIRRV